MTMYRRQSIPFVAGGHYVYSILQRDAIKKMPGVTAYVQGIGLFITDGLAWTLANLTAPDRTTYSFSSASFTGAFKEDLTYTFPDETTATVAEVNDTMMVFVGGALQTYVTGVPAIDEYSINKVAHRWTFGEPLTGQSLHIYSKILP